MEEDVCLERCFYSIEDISWELPHYIIVEKKDAELPASRYLQLCNVLDICWPVSLVKCNYLWKKRELTTMKGHHRKT